MKTLGCSSLFIILLAALVLSSSCGSDSPVIRDAEAAQHVGQNVTVGGTVVAVFTSKNGNTFLNFGPGYPNQTFTGLIPKGSASPGDPSLPSLEGKTVKITGTLELYRGRPEINVLSKSQIIEE